ncbi:uncharacterized protein UBRO_20285 [Ustilago bromivora]|uniref:Uncharacterized protein n=1 Tax=Ustilago bromivora TaxID=307758 RepID=A0A1K0G1V5_9BASI|nr:uncharacterized protein UBRO_20285 [Ustilago bromivora]
MVIKCCHGNSYEALTRQRLQRLIIFGTCGEEHLNPLTPIKLNSASVLIMGKHTNVAEENVQLLRKDRWEQGKEAGTDTVRTAGKDRLTGTRGRLHYLSTGHEIREMINNEIFDGRLKWVAEQLPVERNP